MNSRSVCDSSLVKSKSVLPMYPRIKNLHVLVLRDYETSLNLLGRFLTARPQVLGRSNTKPCLLNRDILKINMLISINFVFRWTFISIFLFPGTTPSFIQVMPVFLVFFQISVTIFSRFVLFLRSPTSAFSRQKTISHNMYASLPQKMLKKCEMAVNLNALQKGALFEKS